MTDKEIASTILEQLGGGRFIAMTGAKEFIAIDSGLQFKLPQKPHYTRDGINTIIIKLAASDTYEFSALKTITRKGVSGMKSLFQCSGLYFDQLESTFTEATGLDTHL